VKADRIRVATIIATGAVVAGALTGAAIVLVLGSVFMRALPPLSLLALGARVGAGFGLVAGPVVAWTLLRRVPIGVGLLGCALGAVVGGSAGLLVGLADWNPYVPLAVSRAPIPQACLGAALGMLLAAIILRRRLRVPPDVSVAAPANER
jgi:hypothetical protein